MHINTCIHPHNVTLYTLPDDQLRYILSHLESERVQLLSEYSRLSNLDSYDFLLSLIRSELAGRHSEWKPVLTNLNASSDGLLASPVPGLRPFDSVERVRREVFRIREMLDCETAHRFLREMRTRIQSRLPASEWISVAQLIQSVLGTAVYEDVAPTA